MRELLISISKVFILFEENSHYFVFEGEKGQLIEVTEVIYNILLSLKSYDLESDSEYKAFMNYMEYKYSKEKLDKGLNEIKRLREKQYFISNDIVYETYKNEYELGEKESYRGGLWLNISHDCNLKCRYCYANGGDYGDKNQIMSEEIAQKCIDYWYENIDKNKKFFEVVFFGGEPLMNQKVFFYVINKINEIVGNLGAKVRYTMATNGTIINDEILTVISNNNFNLSISNDGMEYIHNRNRPYKSGKGSYKDVMKNILKFQQVSKKLVVNMVIMKKDISFVEQSVKELWSKGLNEINISLCMDSNQKLEFEDLESWNNQIKALSQITYENMISGKNQYLSNVYDSVKALLSPKELGKCSLFNNGVFVFAPNGDVYKCHRNVGKEKYKLANINDDNLNLLKYRVEKTKIEKCTKCWAKTMCDDGCPYEHELYNGDYKTPAQELCDKTKIVQKEAVKVLAKLYLNKVKKHI